VRVRRDARDRRLPQRHAAGQPPRRGSSPAAQGATDRLTSTGTGGHGVADELMVAFGPKQAWLAIQGRSHGPVASALGLRALGPVDWRSGVGLAYLTDDRLALTPGLPGARGADWTLVAGRWLLTNSSTVDIVALSTELRTEVQAFSTYRYGEQHRWQRAV